MSYLWILFLFAVCSAQRPMVRHTPEGDLIAQAACTGEYESRGWVYAVRRSCEGEETCNSICLEMLSKRADPQTFNSETWRCFDALHVYDPLPSPQRGVNRLAQKVFRYGHCWDKVCGPNYCCCAVDHDVL